MATQKEKKSSEDLYVKVEVHGSAASKEGLLGEYGLLIGTEGLVLKELTLGTVKANWPFRTVRRYGVSKQLFKMECGRGAPTGEGHWQFRMDTPLLLLEAFRESNAIFLGKKRADITKSIQKHGEDQKKKPVDEHCDSAGQLDADHEYQALALEPKNEGVLLPQATSENTQDLYVKVEVQGSAASKEGLLGEYGLLVGLEGLVLKEFTLGTVKANWPFGTVRRYGVSKQLFKMECCRHAPTGEGHWHFRMDTPLLLLETFRESNAIFLDKKRADITKSTLKNGEDQKKQPVYETCGSAGQLDADHEYQALALEPKKEDVLHSQATSENTHGICEEYMTVPAFHKPNVHSGKRAVVLPCIEKEDNDEEDLFDEDGYCVVP